MVIKSEGHIYSKREGAHWALERLPAEFHALISSALDAYQGDDDPAFDALEVLAFMSFVADRIARPACSDSPNDSIGV